MGLFGTKQQEVEFANGTSVEDAQYAKARLIFLRINAERQYLILAAKRLGKNGASATKVGLKEQEELKRSYDLICSFHEQAKQLDKIVENFKSELGELPNFLLPEDITGE